MSDRKERSSWVVRFAPTEADQILRQAIDKALQDKSYESFSDLCKQALRQLFFPSEAPQLNVEFASALHHAELTALQQQIVALQIQIAKLEGSAGVQQACYVGRLEQRIGDLGDRLDRLESKLDSHPPTALPEPAPPPVEAIDPLLSRLAPLLEDF
ncbi:MAG: hypothetical protein HC769_13665 [Cyanobacteria bacterium CRU_2_1]|nr:hypothetical protein [Cyanobacteria bacterium RU_5_0]NJR59791.1 hypothetical protein [Cyanobacteria bacterium CRU_2_1]